MDLSQLSTEQLKELVRGLVDDRRKKAVPREPISYLVFG